MIYVSFLLLAIAYATTSQNTGNSGQELDAPPVAAQTAQQGENTQQAAENSGANAQAQAQAQAAQLQQAQQAMIQQMPPCFMQACATSSQTCRDAGNQTPATMIPCLMGPTSTQACRGCLSGATQQQAQEQLAPSPNAALAGLWQTFQSWDCFADACGRKAQQCQGRATNADQMMNCLQREEACDTCIDQNIACTALSRSRCNDVNRCALRAVGGKMACVAYMENMDQNTQTQCMITKMMPGGEDNTSCDEVPSNLKQACVGFECRDQYVNPQYCAGQRADCVVPFVMKCNKGMIMGLDMLLKKSYTTPEIRACLKTAPDMINGACSDRTQEECDGWVEGTPSVSTNASSFKHFCMWSGQGCVSRGAQCCTQWMNDQGW